jgi:hypothetical protein
LKFNPAGKAGEMLHEVAASPLFDGVQVMIGTLGAPTIEVGV